VGVEFILPMILAGQITGYENGIEVWAINIAGTGTMDVTGYEENGEYNLLDTTYEFSGIAYTPEPPAWTYAFSALLVILVAQRKKLLSNGPILENLLGRLLPTGCLFTRAIPALACFAGGFPNGSYLLGLP
jgi:hypothetical protein